MRMLRGAPQPAAATGEDGDGGVNQEEDAGSQHQVAAIAKIIAWIRNIWSERAKRVMEDRHLTVRVPLPCASCSPQPGPRDARLSV